ncbi:MAG: type II secretion system secretin GspD [Gammaproteobacteria bacterium]
MNQSSKKQTPFYRLLFVSFLISSLSILSSCESLVNHEPVAPEIDVLLESTDQPEARTIVDEVKTEESSSVVQKVDKAPEFYPGSGVFVGHSHYADESGFGSQKSKGDVTLNFQDTDIHEVVKVVLGDLLKRNYLIDPAVSGTVNIQTSNPLTREDLLPILENLLETSGATMLESDGLIKIVPASSAVLSSLPPGIGSSISSSSGGFHTQIVPLRYVGVDEINKVLQPFLKDTIVQLYPQRNLMILSGAQSDLKRLVETIHIFDVDWLKGMSLAMVPINYANSKDIVSELDNLFGKASGSPLADIVRFIGLERLNSIIVVTQQPHYLRVMTSWIQRLDRSDGVGGQRLYVYQVQNTRAAELAEVLNNIFSDQKSNSSQFPDAELAPGLEPVVLQSDANDGQQIDANDQQSADSSRSPLVVGDGLALPGADAVKIIADESNNSLVILASPTDYQMVESALHKLDITPLQVLIEASIIEVSLTDDLSYGFEWFFKNGTGFGEGQGTLDLDNTAGLNALVPGFSYGIVSAGGTLRAVFNTLASESKANVLSSPSLMVLDNHTATINIGDQVPILTSQSTSNIGDNSPTVNQIEYRDTGVLMTVTPRVNASGLIIMDIKQEVTDVTATNTSGIDAPTFQQRSIESTISVNTGNTIVLGGLIRDNRANSKSGIPGLHKAPIIGPLFGQTDNGLRRTELVVLLTPRVIRNDLDTWEVTNEFKQKLKDLRDQMENDPFLSLENQADN